MLERNSTVIRPEKSKEFSEFLHNKAKDSEYWNEVKRKASTPIDKREIEALFAEDNNR